MRACVWLDKKSRDKETAPGSWDCLTGQEDWDQDTNLEGLRMEVEGGARFEEEKGWGRDRLEGREKIIETLGWRNGKKSLCSLVHVLFQSLAWKARSLGLIILLLSENTHETHQQNACLMGPTELVHKGTLWGLM